jgi:hypothetical protein
MTGACALSMIVKATMPMLALVLTLVCIAAVWHAYSPTYARAEEPQFVDALISTQINRAETIVSSDILIIGDSSGLMNISPTILGRLIDGHVETLATVAYAGPRGIASILDRLSARQVRPRVIVLTLHAAGLPKLEEWSSWTDRVVHGPPKRPLEPNPIRGALGKMNDVVSSIVFRPLEGAYGSYYGGLSDFEAFLRRNHGGAIEPRPREIDNSGPPSKLDWCCSFEISDIFRSEIPILREALARLPATEVRLLVSPLPQRWATPQGVANRAAAISELLDGLGLDRSAVLNTPEYWPGSEFSVPTHLHESAVNRFTRHLADELKGSL